MDLSLLEFSNIIDNHKCAFLCGNGFSCNFDNNFSTVYDRLEDAHKTIVQFGDYNILANEKFKSIFLENFQSVFQFLRYITQNRFEQLFNDGISFADSILSSPILIDELYKEKLISTLVFGKGEIDTIKLISSIGNKKGYKFVNIEFWSLLIYFYFVIAELNPNYYKFPVNNFFIEMIVKGNVNKSQYLNDSKGKAIFSTIKNGLNNYYRMLFCTAILGNGKAIDFTMLEKITSLNLISIQSFLNKFRILFTLNYDHIIEYLIPDRPIIHLHGSYILDKKQYVYYQSLGVTISNKRVEYSNILIGDYFVNKSFMYVMTANTKSDGINNKIPKISDQLDDGIINNKIDTIVLFGMNIENDQHIIRNLMLSLAKQRNQSSIIYCYYSESDKESFQDQYTASITFSPDVCEYVKSVDLKYIKTQEVLAKYFKK